MIAFCFTIGVQDTNSALSVKLRRKEYPMSNAVTDSIRNAPASAKRTYKVEEISKMLGIGRSSAYNLVREGHFKTVRIGTSIRVSKKSFDEWLDRQNL